MPHHVVVQNPVKDHNFFILSAVLYIYVYLLHTYLYAMHPDLIYVCIPMLF
jgi:hypothetical protein